MDASLKGSFKGTHMDLTSTAVDTLPPEVKITYPYLAILDTGVSKTISLFTSVNSGVVLHSEAHPQLVGTYTTDLSENKYAPYHGAITLSM